jgi:hypothetical protein
MAVETIENVENSALETPKIVEKTGRKNIPRSRNTFYCRTCNINFNSIANKRALCPTCAKACSIKITSENAEKYNKIEDIKGSIEKIEFEPSFIQKVETTSIMSQPKTEITEPRKIMKLNPSDFGEFIELFNVGAKTRNIKEISPNEINGIFDTINQYFQENKVFESMGKTGIVDIIFKITGMVLDRLIPVLIEHFRTKKENANKTLENGEKI